MIFLVPSIANSSSRPANNNSRNRFRHKLHPPSLTDGGCYAELVAPATGHRPFIRVPVALDTAIVESPLRHHLVEIPVLRISRIALPTVMADITLPQLREALRAYSMMAPGAGRPLLCFMRPLCIGAYQRFVTFMVKENDSAPPPVIKHDDLIRSVGSRLLSITCLSESFSKQSHWHDNQQQV